jgi:hypothetical protein
LLVTPAQPRSALAEKYPGSIGFWRAARYRPDAMRANLPHAAASVVSGKQRVQSIASIQ